MKKLTFVTDTLTDLSFSSFVADATNIDCRVSVICSEDKSITINNVPDEKVFSFISLIYNYFSISYVSFEDIVYLIVK